LARARPQPVVANPADVFLNLAFDPRREYLYLALITGVVGVGLNPRCVVELPANAVRLERLRQLIASCRYSIHDMSAVEVTARPFRVPRFNMPFELGLAIGIQLESHAHECRVMEAVRHRVDQSLSDLRGFDAYIHGGTPEGVLDAVRNLFAAIPRQPLNRRRDFAAVFDTLSRFRRSRDGRGDPFTAVQFGSLVIVAKGAAEALRQ
jgi:hypothetical protein